LLYGLDEDHGIWGGLNRAERARLRRLRERLSRAPTDRANGADIKRLVAVGLAPERLSTLLGLAVETIVDVVEGDAARENALGSRAPVPLPHRRLAEVGAGV
jgi:hypothetical protein